MPEKAANVETNVVGMFAHDDEHARTFDAGATVFAVEDAADCMYVVVYGVVEIRLDGIVLERVKPGGIIGEMALIDDLPRSATAVAMEEARLSVVDKKRFLFLVQNHPYFALQVMQVLANRLRRMDTTLRENAAPNRA